jgi:acyl carrier protein
VADVWAEVLGAERVGRTDDFFALGGHSLSAMRVVSRLEQDLGVTIPLRTFFDATTVSAFARALVALDPSLATDAEDADADAGESSGSLPA